MTETNLNLLGLLQLRHLLNFVRVSSRGVLRYDWRSSLLWLLLKDGHFFAIDTLDQLKIKLLQLLISADVHSRHEDLVHRLIEIGTSGVALIVFEV